MHESAAPHTRPAIHSELLEHGCPWLHNPHPVMPHVHCTMSGQVYHTKTAQIHRGERNRGEEDKCTGKRAERRDARKGKKGGRETREEYTHIEAGGGVDRALLYSLESGHGRARRAIS